MGELLHGAAHSDVRTSCAQAPVGTYFPYFKVTVIADMLMFRPEVGSRLSASKIPCTSTWTFCCHATQWWRLSANLQSESNA